MTSLYGVHDPWFDLVVRQAQQRAARGRGARGVTLNFYEVDTRLSSLGTDPGAAIEGGRARVAASRKATLAHRGN